VGPTADTRNHILEITGYRGVGAFSLPAEATGDDSALEHLLNQVVLLRIGEATPKTHVHYMDNLVSHHFVHYLLYIALPSMMFFAIKEGGIGFWLS
jgi:hypothetical protein